MSWVFIKISCGSWVCTEQILDDTTVKGYPIISTDTRRTLLGYIDGAELRYVLGKPNNPLLFAINLPLADTELSEKARAMHDITSDTPCSFAAEPEDHEDVEFSGMGAAPGVGMDEAISAEIVRNTSTPEAVKLWPWVNQVCSLTCDVVIFANVFHRRL